MEGASTPSGKRRNGIFLVIDALRYDTLENEAARRVLFPTLARLVEGGHLVKLTTNAQATQFVMPALFSQTYPLDYGGYNRGIKDRPASYVEVLRDAGYATGLYSACNQLGVGMGYERGFDLRCAAIDYRLLIEHRISRFLAYYIEAMQRGERTEAEVLALVREEFAELLRQILLNFEREDKSAWPAVLWKVNRRVVAGVEGELALIAAEPRAVLAKLMRIPAGNYWHFLGWRSIGRARLFLTRAIDSVRWRNRRWLNKRRFPPFILLSHIEGVAPEILKPVIERVAQGGGAPWHLHIHLMDVHDSRAINRFGNFLARLGYLPRWMKGRAKGLTRRHWIYETALMYVDAKLAPLVAALERSGQLDDTCIAITGDHGNNFALSPRKKGAIAARTYREDIEVPLVVRAPWMHGAARDGLFDSMAVSATLLHCLGVNPHPAFEGRSVFERGKDIVVTESCGSGNADVAARDLHFTVTGTRYKMMAKLCGTRLELNQLFDLANDPDEIADVARRAESKPIVDQLVASLMRERAGLFALRGVDAPRWQAPDQPMPARAA
jgi:sulfatase-like protein